MKRTATIPKIICTEFYDGAVSGFCEIVDGDHPEAYRFELVSSDKWMDIRIFGLAPMPPGTFETIVALRAESAAPKWPFWGPQNPREETDQQVAPIKDQSNQFAWLILTDSYMKKLRRKIAIDDAIREKLPAVLPCYDSAPYKFWRGLFGK